MKKTKKKVSDNQLHDKKVSIGDFSSIKETEYLLSTEANKIHLKESIENIKAGKVARLPLDQLWK
jgi:hypothetical protein